MNVIKKGTTDVTRYIMLVDSAAGTPETGYTIANLDLQYTRNRTAPAVKVDAVALAATDTAHTDNRAIEIDGTSSPGLYRIDWPDAAFATGADKVLLVVSGTGLHPAIEEIQLVDFDPADGVRLGLTALPNAAADGAGGLPISDAGGLDLDAVGAAVTSGTHGNAALKTLIDTVDTVADAILADTGTDGVVVAAGSKAGYALSASGMDAVTLPANLITATSIATDAITDAKVASDVTIASVTGAVGSVAGNVVGSVGSLATQAKADVNAEADAALADVGLTTTVTGRIDAAISTRQATFTSSTGVTLPATVASSDEVTAIQNNTRVVRVVPAAIERPDSGTTTYRIELLLYDTTGNMEAPDSAPTLALVNQGGTDLSSRLDSATGALVSTGRYRWVYTASVGDTLEQLVWTFSVVEGGNTRLYGNTSVIVDTTAVDFTSSDRTTLNGLATSIGTVENLGTGATLAKNLRDVAGATFDRTTDALEPIRDRGDAAWTTATGFSTHSAADVWAAGTRTLTAATNITSTGGTITVSTGAVTVGTNNDKTGYALSATGLNLVVPADPSAEPVPGTSSIVVWIGFFGAISLNKITSDSDSVNLRNTADDADIVAYPTSDNGTTFVSGPGA